MIPNDRISGFGNPNQVQQFAQTNTTGTSFDYRFYAFTPVNGDATFTTLKAIGSTANIATAWNTSGNYFQNVTYFGPFNEFTLLTGEILIHLSE